MSGDTEFPSVRPGSGGPKIGRTISHYEILSKLGEGGMGEVWEARDTRLDRTVAIKLIPRHLSANPAARKRFVREARAASSIEHANICTIHEIDETPDGETFIVMPRYQGEVLADRIACGRAPLDESLRIVEDLAGALAEAHDHGIVHRDVKPANIMIDPHGRPILLDFGLAKLTEHTKVTRTGATVGTMAYMAPEQAAGKDVDGRADLFSLGMILYELLTGVRPFRGDHNAAVLYQIAHEPAPPLASHDPDLPAALQTIIDRSLAKDPDERYASLHEAKAAISELRREVQSGPGISVRDARPSPFSKRWAIPVAVVLVAAAPFAVYKLLPESANMAPVDEAIAVVEFTDLTGSDDPNRSRGMAGLIHVGMVENAPCRVVSPSYLQEIRRRLFGQRAGPIEESEALEIAREAGATVLLSGQIGQLDGSAHVTWQLVDTKSGSSVAAQRAEGAQSTDLADAVLEGVLPALTRHVGEEAGGESESVTALTTADAKAYDYYVAGKVALERRQLDEAARMFDAAVARDTTFALAYFDLAKTHRRRLIYGKARTNTERAWQWRSRLSIQDRMRLEAWREQLYYRGAAAIDVYRELHERWPDDKNILAELAHQLVFWRFHKECLDICQQGMTLFPNEPRFLYNYEFALTCVGRAQDALQAARRLVDKFPDNPNHWDELALRFIGVGLPDSAEIMFNRALEREPGFFSSSAGLAALPYYRGDAETAFDNFSRFVQRTDLSPDSKYRVYMAMGMPVGSTWMLYESGKYRRVIDRIDEAGALLTDPVDEIYHLRYRFNYFLRLGRAREVLRWVDTEAVQLSAEFGTGERNLQLAGIVRWTALDFRARALAALDSLDAARRAAAALMEAAQEFGNHARLQSLRISARVALKDGDGEAALGYLDQVAQSSIGVGVDHIRYLELRAEAYRIAGRLEEAVAAHDEILKVNGGHALSYYRLGHLYEQMDRPGEAAGAYQRFAGMWANADADLPELRDVRVKLAALGAD